MEEEVGGDLFEHGSQQFGNYFVEEEADGFGDVGRVDVVDTHLAEDELGVLLPDIFLGGGIRTPRSLSMSHSLRQVCSTTRNCVRMRGLRSSSADPLRRRERYSRTDSRKISEMMMTPSMLRPDLMRMQALPIRLLCSSHIRNAYSSG